MPQTASVGAFVEAMTGQNATSALVIDAEGKLAGIVTEQDVARRIALRCQGGEAITQVMTAPVESIAAADYLYRAIAKMRQRGWRHMPVVDGQGRPCGMIDLRDALSVAGEQVLRQIDRVSAEDSLEGLSQIKSAQVDLADDLMRDHVPAPEVQALLSHINQDIHRRILEMHLKQMDDLGWGRPPVRFCLIIMGSGGRGENYLYPDQDNGFILEDYPDADHGRVDPFYIELAERMTGDLAAVGIPFCNGYVMATNPLWRKTRSQWRAQVNLWGRKRSTIAIQLSDIFFDFRGAYGKLDYATELRQLVTAVAKASPAFLAEIQREGDRIGVALGWFGRLRTESEKPEHKGEINLKHSGTLPLVQSLRLLALREGVDAVSTLERIEALHRHGVLDGDEQDYLKGGFKHITGLLLRQQIADFKAQKKVSNYVRPEALSERERDILIDSLEAIKELQARVKLEFTGDIF